MRNKIISVFALIIEFLIFSYPANAQTTTLTATGHPRIFLNPSKVAQLRTLYQNVQNGTRGAVPLNGNLFPATGSLSFELFIDTSYLHPQQTMGLFDEYDETRNHIFIRFPFAANYDSLQLAFQKANTPSYVVAKSFRIKANKWNRFTLGWNTNTDSAYIKVEYYSGSTWNLFRSFKFKMTDPLWVPNQQIFKFRGNGYLDNVAVYSSYIPSPSSYIAKFNMETRQGTFTVADSISQMQGVVKLYGDSVLVSHTYNNIGHSVYLNSHTVPPSKNPSTITEFYIRSTDYHADALKQQMNTAYSYIQSLNLNTFKCSSCRAEGDYYRGVINTAFMWQITGDTIFRDKAIGLIDTLLTCPRNCEALSPCGLNDQATRARIMTMGLLYDWMYDDIDPLRRSRLIDSIKTSLRYDYPSWVLNMAGQICGSGSFTSGGFTCAINTNPSFYGGHSYNTCRAILMAVLAIIDAAPDLQPLLDKLSGNFKNGFDPIYQYIINDDGGHPMGYSYGTGYDLWDATYLLNQLTTDKHKITWPSHSYKRFLYAMRGDCFPKLGDDFSDAHGFGAFNSNVFPSYPIYASRFNNDGIAQYYLEFVMAPYRNIWANYQWFYDIVFGDSTATPLSYSSLPLAKKFSVSGLISCRDNWDIPNTALLNFKSSNFIGSNHVHADNNSFELYYKAPLIIDAGYYDSYGTSHWKNYYTRTIAHNAVTVYNPSQTPLADGAALDGGQLTTEQIGVNYPTLPEIQPNGLRWVDGIDSLNGYDHHISQDYTYFKSDATKAYPSSNVKQSVREIVYTRNGAGNWQHPLIFVYDKVKSVNAAYVKRVHWHTINQPTKAGKRYTIINEKGKAYLDILYPVQEHDTLFGGAGRNFWVNNPVTGTGTNYNLSCTTCDSSQAGKWRIDVSPANPDTSDYFLNVIAVDDASDNSSLITTGGNGSHTQVVYAVINNNLLVSFSKLDTAITNLTINALASYTNAIITGLKPNCKYQILKNGNTISAFSDINGNYITSNAGVLYAENIIVTKTSPEKYETNFSVYPNPFRESTTIDFGNIKKSSGDNLSFHLYNLLGKEVASFTNISTEKLILEKKNLAEGMYLYKVMLNGESIGNGKLIVN